MTDLRELPRTGAWEVDLFDPPDLEVKGVDLEGLLLVIEAWSGLVRHAEPLVRGADVTASLVRAATAPPPPSGRGRA